MTPVTLSIVLSFLMLGSGINSQQSNAQQTTDALTSANAFAQGGYKTYSNARFGYSVSYPANILIPQGESDNITVVVVEVIGGWWGRLSNHWRRPFWGGRDAAACSAV